MALNDTFGFPALTAELTQDEGRSSIPYTDTKGYLSIGIGRNLTGRGLEPAEIDLLFANDVALCCAQMDAAIPFWRTLPPTQQRVMINLCFMGWGTLRTFVRFLAAMQAHDFHTAADELANSRWYRQVGTRGPRVVTRLSSQGPTS